MRAKIVLTTLALMLVPGLALATGYELVPQADCDGWSVTAYVRFGTVDRDFVLDYTVTLTDVATGAVVVTDTGSRDLGFTPSITVPFAFAGDWGEELCGKYNATGVFTIMGTEFRQERTFAISFICECETPGCFRTPGYWKNHPDDPAWPDDGFAVGGTHYSNAELDAILERPVKDGATVVLAHHLIAAKLNVLAGEVGIAEYDDAISDGDDLLAIHPLGIRIKGDAKDDVITTKDILESYNELGCDDEDDDDFDDVMMFEKAAEEEVSTWGDLKSRYR